MTASSDAKRWARKSAKTFASATLRRLESGGVHVLPRHFYSSVPDRRWLKQNEHLWKRPATMAGVDWDLDKQEQWLAEVCEEKYLNEVAGFSFLHDLNTRGIPFRYGLIEAQVLHCFIRSHPPARIVEIGSGASTAIMASALQRNRTDQNEQVNFTVVDPYLAPGVAAIEDIRPLSTSALETEFTTFEALGEGDLLFIDSSHAVKTGSEVSRLYTDVIPALKPGVVVHIHDVYLPYRFSPWVLDDLWDWQESALLLALLIGNHQLRVLCAESALHHDRPDRLKNILPDYRPLETSNGVAPRGVEGHFPSSCWLVTG